ncbi:MAG: energy-coupling factor ABC transporter permease [Oscillospiraceae bacterium]|nr:energy-coupling factor ABC transporter permease [Oscillospiraceae bacterium]
MHMADALLSPAVGIAMDVVSAGALGFAATRVKKDGLSDKKIPLMGIAGALVFAGQMINFTIPGTGSSGHIGGGILLSGLLGGAGAFISIAAVLIIQCLFFADGGLLALGCNLFNMGVIPCLIIYPLLFKPLLRHGVSRSRLSIASVLCVMLALEIGAFGVVLQTFLSGVTTLPFGTFVLFMLPIHLAIGLVEGLVTAAVLSFVYSARPEILDSAPKDGATGQSGGVSAKKVFAALAALAVITGGIFSLFASQNPDGLEWSLENAGVELTEQDGLHKSAAEVQDTTALLPDYGFKNTNGDSGALGTSASGLAGATVTFALAGGVGFVISKIKRRRTNRN